MDLDKLGSNSEVLQADDPESRQHLDVNWVPRADAERLNWNVVFSCWQSSDPMDYTRKLTGPVIALASF